LVDDIILWHHHDGDQIILEKNLVQLEPDGSFDLTEESGSTTHFALVRNIESPRCK
jgi:hypothetical protein